MKFHVLDDWYGMLADLPCMARLADHEVTNWTDHAPDAATHAKCLSCAEAVVLFRDRTAITANLAAMLDGTKLIAMRGQQHVDVGALSRAGILFCSRMTKHGPSISTAELAFTHILSALRYRPDQIASARAGA